MGRFLQTAIILFVFFTLACRGKEKETAKEANDCSKIRTGQYEYRGYFSQTRIGIERNDSFQTEIERTSGIGMKLKISWPSACEYVLSFDSFLGNEAMDRFDSINARDYATRSNIIKVTSNYYIAETVVEGKGIKNRDTILIIK